MRVLVACEESQAVTIAFRKLGYEAYSCDMQDCSGGHPEWHIKDNTLNHLNAGWDLMIGHPPCTYLSYAGMAHWNKPGRLEKRIEALKFFAALYEAPIPFIALENPKSCASPVIAKYDQIIQPYYFGDDHQKTTCLWLKNLPLLKPTNILPKPEPVYIDKKGKRIYTTDAISGNKAGQIKRSKTFQGVANAMAEQWGAYVSECLNLL